MKTVSRTIKLAMLVLLPAKALPCPAWQADPGTQARPVTSAPQGRSSSQTPQMSPGSTPEPPTTQTQTSVPGPGESPEFTREVNAMIARESQLLRSLQTYVPRMETYIQDVRPDPELGSAPVNDHYFLGRLKLQPDGTITVQSLLPKSLSLAFVKNAAGHVAPPPHIIQYEPRAFY